MRLFDFVNQGGLIMWILLLVNIFGLTTIGWRFFVLWDFRKKVKENAQLLFDKLNVMTRDKKIDATLLKDQIGLEISDLEFGMNFIKMIATIAPLLGLLGTVVGIFDAFQVISSKGLNNPSEFAEGISLALITTIGGLIVAIPHFVAHNMLSSQLDKLELVMEKELTPLIYEGN